MLPLSILWEVDPIAISIGPLSVRWYGLFFATGFMIGYYIVAKMFEREGVSEDYLDSLLMWLFVGTVVGARFGHVVFWQWDYYSQHLSEIPQIWKGGLASHGAMVMIPTILFIYAKRIIKKPPLWLLDRVAVPIAMVGGFIRLGNLMNHEIVGKVTNVSWAFLFTLHEQNPQPRHPVQLYESLSYFLLFAIMFYMYWKTDARKRTGLLTGVFFAGIFGIRIFAEYFKQHFFEYELGMMESFGLNFGQLLSVPAVLFGIGLIIYAMRKPIAEST